MSSEVVSNVLYVLQNYGSVQFEEKLDTIISNFKK